MGSQITVGRDAYVFSTDVFTVTAGAARFLTVRRRQGGDLTPAPAAGTYAYSTRTVDMDEGNRSLTGTRMIIGTVIGTVPLVAANSVLNLTGAEHIILQCRCRGDYGASSSSRQKRLPRRCATPPGA